jgi:hypothetical protein
VPDGHFVFEDGRVRAVRDVDDGSILNVCAIADAYMENIAAHDRVEPDARLLADVHIADDLRALFDESRRMNLRVRAAKWSNHKA